MNEFMDRLMKKELLDRIDQLGPIAADLGISMTQLALAWVLHEPNLAAAIIGASRPQQVLENASASGIRLDKSTMKAIDQVLAGVVSA